MMGFFRVTIAGETEYRFERLWPTLQQPWYFVDFTDLAVGPGNILWATDVNTRQAIALTLDGRITNNLAFGQDFLSLVAPTEQVTALVALSMSWIMVVFRLLIRECI